tara:strand:+ start:581 stop:952 length:372 start_codon:yes stop_codon:yes gene_type:complete
MRKKNKKANQFNRASKTVLGHMDKIFQKHRDTKPMDEQFFEAFKEVFDIEAYLKDLFCYSTQTQYKNRKGKMAETSSISVGRNGDYRPTATNLVATAVHIMKIAYELHAQSSKPEKEEITLNA